MQSCKQQCCHMRSLNEIEILISIFSCVLFSKSNLFRFCLKFHGNYLTFRNVFTVFSRENKALNFMQIVSQHVFMEKLEEYYVIALLSGPMHVGLGLCSLLKKAMCRFPCIVRTLQPLYNTVHYNSVLDITRFKDGSQKCIGCIEKWP